MIDWKGLKALEAKALADDTDCHGLLFRRQLQANWPEILAQHEQDQNVIEAADKMKYCLLFCKDQTTDYRVRAAIDSAIDRFDKAAKPRTFRLLEEDEP